MKARVLRNCYTGELFYYKDDIVDVPEEKLAEVKNFVALGKVELAEFAEEDVADQTQGGIMVEKQEEAVGEIDNPADETPPDKESAPLVDEKKQDTVSKTPPYYIPPTQFWCYKCEMIHFLEKQNGKPNPHFAKYSEPISPPTEEV